MENNTTTTAPRYWDGESMIVLGLDDSGLPVLLEPECSKAKNRELRERDDTRQAGATFSAEDFDRKCSDMDHFNSWYRK